MSIQDAFYEICEEAEEALQGYYVVLRRRSQQYGGPEEGGWWYTDFLVEAYQKVDSLALAEETQARVLALAKDLSAQERRKYGDYCLRQMEIADRTGCEVSDDGDNGPDELFVVIETNVPKHERQPRTGYC